LRKMILISKNTKATMSRPIISPAACGSDSNHKLSGVIRHFVTKANKKQQNVCCQVSFRSQQAPVSIYLNGYVLNVIQRFHEAFGQVLFYKIRFFPNNIIVFTEIREFSKINIDLREQIKYFIYKHLFSDVDFAHVMRNAE